ncbi:hypothetical protein CPC08DRAFT_91643 [Agrocybe pediades]|nr:hypothetical protein CPC08DRAFT_91643 [Agrocybe pediades]
MANSFSRRSSYLYLFFMDFVALPLHLILLVHLHILEYPYANNPEYDHDLFNPRTRGLRERVKAMEDIAYFLVGRIERKPAKSVLATYPCLQPSDSLAFRTSLAKYLEGLRHSTLFPSSTRATAGKPNPKPSEGNAKDAGWWWKDVVVRKSLLEECSGEKFERLILALSTHAIMKGTYLITTDKMSAMISSLPSKYATKLAQYQAKRHTWTKSASLLMKHENDLKRLRDSLGQPILSKYESISTERLRTLATSKRHALLRQLWTGDEGEGALSLLMSLAGLHFQNTSVSFSLTHPDSVYADPNIVAIPSPLPMAAAHHPSHLKRLRKPIFQLKAKPGSTPGIHSTNPTGPHAQVALSEHLDSEKRMRQMLSNALANTQRKHAQLRLKYESLKGTKLPSSNSTIFWTCPTRLTKTIDFQPTPDRNLMVSVGLEDDYDALTMEEVNGEDSLETKIAHIRQNILPPYPSAPDPTAPRIPTNLPAKVAVKSVQAPKTRLPVLKHPHAGSPPSSSTAPPNSFSPPIKTSNSPQPSMTSPITSPLMSPSKSARSIRLQSVRFSMAQRRTGRPSMFRVFSSEIERLVDETNDFSSSDDEESDSSSDFALAGASSSLGSCKTPKGKARKKSTNPKTKPVINRIWTAGTPKSRGEAQATMQGKMRVSSSCLGKLMAVEPEVGLLKFGDGGGDGDGDGDGDVFGEDRDDGGGDRGEEGSWEARDVDVDATPRPARRRVASGLASRAPASAPVASEGVGEEEDDDDECGDGQRSMTLKEILLSSETSHFDLLEFSNEDVEDGMLIKDSSFVWE